MFPEETYSVNSGDPLTIFCVRVIYSGQVGQSYPTVDITQLSHIGEILIVMQKVGRDGRI